MSNFLKISSLLMGLFLIGCGSDDSGDSSNPNVANRINWPGISKQYNPTIHDLEFGTDGISKISLNAFGFNNDVEVVYTNKLPADAGYLRIFKVYKETASWGYLQPRSRGTTIELEGSGTYQCSIRITNKEIASLKGGCYVRLQVFLPIGSEIEVYNVGQLITKRFFPMSNEDFLDQLDNATWAADKLAVIETFLGSYKSLNKRPTLTTEQLGVVLSEFSWAEEKYKALKRLHSLIVDRENLGQMIEDKFTSFDREEARRIVGL